jgi:hypothetical protein
MKIYAFLIGLNEYQDTRIPFLGGCVNDINQFENYLLKGLNVPQKQIVKLLDKQATKANVVSNFQKHLGQATKNDTCIFYFAGHGIRQHANPVFKNDAVNDKLECITCFDTKLEGQNLIADKEQRWLIHQLSAKTGGCHIVTIFDCCHSGDNTRAVGQPPSTAKARFVPDLDNRGGEYVMPMRPYSDFIFAKQISEQAIADTLKQGDKLNDILPQGKHIQLAACANNETAKEKGGRGYFSKYLLELLEGTNGKITYFDLRSLIYRRLSNFPPSDRQTPQFYAVNDSIFQSFLGSASQSSTESTVSFNTEKKRWEMNMGAIYGVTKDATVFVRLPHKNNEVEAALVKEVFHDCSVLSFDIESAPGEAEKLEKDRRIRRNDHYKADVGSFMQQELKLACADTKLAAKWDAFCQKRAASLEKAKIKKASSPAQADYVLNTEGGQLFIARPNAAARPLVKMIEEAGSEKSFEQMLEQMAAISKWEFVRQQKSPAGSENLLKHISVSFTQAANTESLDAKDKVTRKVKDYTWYDEADANFWNDTLSIKVVNNHPTQTLYLAGIWLSELFGLDCTVVKEQAIAMPIEPNKSVFIYDEVFNLTFKKNVLIDKWDKIENYLKVYVASSPFDITQLQQADLEYPRKENLRSSREEEKSRGAIRLPQPAQSMPAWAVKTITFELDVAGL